jgi:hypothetical protein
MLLLVVGWAMLLLLPAVTPTFTRNDRHQDSVPFCNCPCRHIDCYSQQISRTQAGSSRSIRSRSSWPLPLLSLLLLLLLLLPLLLLLLLLLW